MAAVYFTVRCLVGGVLVFPSRTGRGKKHRAVYMLGGLITVIIWGSFTVGYYALKGEPVNRHDAVLGMVIGGIVVFVVFSLFFLMAQRFADKGGTEDDK